VRGSAASTTWRAGPWSARSDARIRRPVARRQARLYAALPWQSGVAIAGGGFGGFAGAAVTLVLGLVAGAAGLGATMWILLLAPVVLLVLAPRDPLP
jgi:hypothetical protein